MAADHAARSAPVTRRIPARGLTLLEVAISICLVMVIVLSAAGARYLTVKQAVRADAYNTAGRIATLVLEGWRSTEPALYNPATRLSSLSPDVMVTVGVVGCPAAPSGFTTLDTYRVVTDGMNFYLTLAYTAPDLTAGAEHPSQLHAAVAFLNGYESGDASTSPNRVSLTSYR